MAVIIVGAINVSSIETNVEGLVNPHHWNGDRYKLVEKNYDSSVDEVHNFAAGADLGTFRLGSTVICLFGKDVEWLENLESGQKVRMGQAMTAPDSEQSTLRHFTPIKKAAKWLPFSRRLIAKHR